MKTIATQKGDSVTRARGETGLSMGKFAVKCGVSRPVISNIESGVPVRETSAYKVAQALEKPFGELFDIAIV